MPQYMFLLHDEESWYDTATQESWDAEMALHREFLDAVHAAGGVLLAGEALDRSSLTTTVDNSATDPIVTDGPFIETKEVFGGFYLLELADLDVAIALAKKCPSGHVEIRPVLPTPPITDASG